MNDLLRLQRTSRLAPILAAWLAVWGTAMASGPGERLHVSGFQPVVSPMAWHREHWRRHRRDPGFTVELPWALFDPYFSWGQAPRPVEPPRPAPLAPRQRGEMWRDDVVGSGRGGRFEEHPEGRILRSRPRGD
ncbi:hypothetical protein HOP62_07685 [Halomonas sp. MCCC 1A17488]|uniref:hypothetical protein n=1 Tax=unclassified Halomonas TaxID=2609666 RepID=UPI0018D24053|nr:MULTISPECIES: hypothetical protein [unclassified Halomonas]MCE8015955.1 hypothetical protein [Halomonas sp. MCCC 1A17488]MCG3239288.1 hypothetical protein [Halomonas sp. MCCC 1A17488]QPP50779.1 hypothetical protein I4484_06700 [Halomonas sp. SS10-MC5]